MICNNILDLDFINFTHAQASKVICKNHPRKSDGMAAAIYWKKDDPDEFQVKDVNVPGVFPKPSTKVNQNTVVASAKPWLQRNTVHQNKDPSSSRPKSAAGFGSDKSGERRNAKKITTPHGNERLQQHRAKLQSSLDGHLRMSASLKDLCSEDKQRITNLIKELAKAGEERKTAVGALHKERLSFKDKEDLLIQEQEKLVMERDELREKILEYQFLINQYNKQIRDEKDVFEGVEPRENDRLQDASANSRVPNQSDIHAQLNDPSNIKPPLTASESRLEKIPTYYSLPENTKDELSQAHSENFAGRNMTSSEEFVANVYTGSQNFVPESANDIQRDSTVLPKGTNSTPESKLLRTEKSWDGQITLNHSHNLSVEVLKEKLAMDKMQLKMQHNLLEQQQRLLEQQMQIQEQLENLQEIHKKFADEMSQAPMQKQKIVDLENAIKNLKHRPANKEELKEIMKRDNAETVVQFGKSSRENSIKKKSPTPEAHPGEVHPLQRKGNSTIYQVDHRRSIEEPTHAVEMSPGFSLHSRNPENSSLNMREPRRPQRPQSRNTATPVFTASCARAYYGHESSRKSSNKNYNKKRLMHQQSLDYFNQEPENSTSEVESNTHGVLNQQATQVSKQKPHLRQTPRHFAMEDNNGSHFSQRTPHKSSRRPMSLSKQHQQRHDETLKQTSLLSILDTLETESNSDDNDDFDLGSYLGISKKILEGKYSNDKIFASTDYSDEGDAVDDSELLEDLFFLKKF